MQFKEEIRVKLVLVRHGQSVLNLENVFTGWIDAKLSPLGIEEAQNAGKLIKEAGIEFDTVHTSVLSRAIQTAFYALNELDQLYLPVKKSWRLNERHYGALQGLNKAETAEKYGDEQVHIWRRSYDTRPPLLEGKMDDPRYKDMDDSQFLQGECLKDTLERVMPYWIDNISVDLKKGNDVLVAAHGNSLRSLVKYLEKISDEEILNLEIATGEPIVYEIDEDLNIVSKEILHKHN